MASTKLEAVIFDVDGTLADTERDGHRLAFNAAFRQYGLGWHWDEAFYGELLAIGGGKERIRAYVERYAGRVFQADLDAWITRLHAAKTRHFTALLQQPDIYRWVLERLALPPESCLAAEDSANGLKAAIGAGLRTLITVNGYTARDDFTDAVAVLSDLGEPQQPVAAVLKGGLHGREYVDAALLAAWLNPV